MITTKRDEWCGRYYYFGRFILKGNKIITKKPFEPDGSCKKYGMCIYIAGGCDSFRAKSAFIISVLE